jgi:hypothetical protein
MGVARRQEDNPSVTWLRNDLHPTHGRTRAEQQALNDRRALDRERFEQ